MVETIDVLGVDIALTDLDKAAFEILLWVNTKKKTYVCLAPASTLVDYQKDKAYQQVLKRAGMVTPDGMPVVWLARHRSKKEVQRTYGPDLMLKLCQAGLAQGLRHYFLGSTELVNTKLTENLKAKFPGLQIVGHFAPAIRKIGEAEPADVLKSISDAKPDILWVGLGSPKQDFWMSNHRAILDVPVMIGVGAAFDFIAGTKKQAPLWMRRRGLEWMFRLCCEPRRLWRRYLVGNPTFFWLVVKEMIFGKKKAL